jgi:alpha-mannosidase
VRLARDFHLAQKQAAGLTGMMDLYGIGDHGGGPTRAILDEGRHWAYPSLPAYVMPKIEFGTALPYFTALEKQIAPNSPVWDYPSIAKGYTPPPPVAGMVNIPTWKSELYFEYHRGVMTTQANHKKNMRESEVEMLDAEKWASLAWVLAGRAYPSSDLTEDWKKVLFNQFHDTAAGSGIGVIYKDAQKDYDVVRWSTNEINASAFPTIVGRIDTRGKGARTIPVAVFNPLGWERSGDVTFKIERFWNVPSILEVIDNGADSRPQEPLPKAVEMDKESGITEITVHVSRVPALGYKVLRVISVPIDGGFNTVGMDGLSSQSGTQITLRGLFFSLTVDKASGCITSIRGISGYEFLAPGACGNQLEFFKDLPKQYDAWNIDPGTLDATPSTVAEADTVVLLGRDSPHPAIRVTRTWQSSRFVQTISLPSIDADYIDIDNDFDWHESHVLLKAAFPLAASGPFATYEIPYGTIDRPTTRNNSWEKAQFEVTALRWADLSGPGPDGKVHGLSVLNQNKYGYDAVGNVLRLTLLRSPKWPDAEADMGHHHFHYALYPHAGTWKDALTVRRGYEYNYPLTAVVTTAHPGALPPSHSFASVSPENVVLTAVKKAEDQNGLGVNGLIFRVYEWAGKETTAEFHVPPGATSATVTNLMETPEGKPLPVTGDVVKAPIHPYEILTIRVDYPNAGPKP